MKSNRRYCFRLQHLYNMAEHIIEQDHYGQIIVDTREPDIIEILNYQGGVDIVQIERTSIPRLIEILQAEIEIMK